MANTYPIVNLNKIQASYNGNIESVKYASALNQGSLITLGALVSGETEVYTAVVPAAATLATEEVLLVASPEVLYDSAGKNLGDYRNAANAISRAYHLTIGDTFTVTGDAFSAAPTAGQYAIAANVVFTLTPSAVIGTDRFSAYVVRQTTLGFDENTAWELRVVRC